FVKPSQNLSFKSPNPLNSFRPLPLQKFRLWIQSMCEIRAMRSKVFFGFEDPWEKLAHSLRQRKEHDSSIRLR
ncbi:hypothetical protein Gorai_011127, partial [Gossypium raimondii]|nr:hypothetical protein [Gossypium raimondii]